ncbi:uncharacterized protein LOC125038073 [Penaeus chinensis]|uniref:uncharacterized protein LOC125038073 n=1 Tax=Penaeus chinensis TaxID=139456 RepID=UPI001FB7D7BB|nr:uncharacterized protein LOC125038073 [Penaeus chinensis]
MRARHLLLPLLAMGVACGRRDLVGQQVCGNQLVELLSFICRGRYYSPRDRRVSAPAAARSREAPLRQLGEGATFSHSAPSLRSDSLLQPPSSVLSGLPLRQDSAKPKDAFAGYSEEVEDAFRKRSGAGVAPLKPGSWVGRAWQPLLSYSLASDSSSIIPQESFSSRLLLEDRWIPPFLPRRSASAFVKTREKRGFTIVDECCRLKACNLDELLAYCG